MKGVAIPGLVLGAIFFVGCVPSSEQIPAPGPQITLQEARQFQNQELLDLGEYVPREHVRGEISGPIERMSAMKCDWAKGPAFSSKNSGVFLPGGYDIEIQSETDTGAILDRILEDYESRGWTVVEEGSGDDRELELTSSDGYTFYVRFYNSDVTDQEFVISSFSPCIKAPDDFDIFEKY